MNNPLVDHRTQEGSRQVRWREQYSTGKWKFLMSTSGQNLQPPHLIFLRPLADDCAWEDKWPAGIRGCPWCHDKRSGAGSRAADKLDFMGVDDIVKVHKGGVFKMFGICAWCIFKLKFLPPTLPQITTRSWHTWGQNSTYKSTFVSNIVQGEAWPTVSYLGHQCEFYVPARLSISHASSKPEQILAHVRAADRGYWLMDTSPSV